MLESWFECRNSLVTDLISWAGLERSRLLKNKPSIIRILVWVLLRFDIPWLLLSWGGAILDALLHHGWLTGGVDEDGDQTLGPFDVTWCIVVLPNPRGQRRPEQLFPAHWHSLGDQAYETTFRYKNKYKASHRRITRWITIQQTAVSARAQDVLQSPNAVRLWEALQSDCHEGVFRIFVHAHFVSEILFFCEVYDRFVMLRSYPWPYIEFVSQSYQ